MIEKGGFLFVEEQESWFVGLYGLGAMVECGAVGVVIFARVAPDGGEGECENLFLIDGCECVAVVGCVDVEWLCVVASCALGGWIGVAAECFVC